MTDLNKSMKLCGLDPKGKTFDDWGFDDTQKARQARLLENLQGYAQTINRQSPNILITGGTGTGKTLLCNALGVQTFANYRAGVTPCYLEKTASITRRVKETWNRPDKSEQDILRYLASVQLLILDDLGDGDSVGGDNGANDRARFGQLINDRYEKRPTIITTNLTIDNVAKFVGDRAWDRFSQNFVLIECNWGSFRQKTAHAVSW